MDKRKASNRISRAKSLTLNKEVVRVLQNYELAVVVGGATSELCSARCDYSSAIDTKCSDRRLKKSIRRIPRALEIIALL